MSFVERQEHVNNKSIFGGNFVNSLCAAVVSWPKRRKSNERKKTTKLRMWLNPKIYFIFNRMCYYNIYT